MEIWKCKTCTYDVLVWVSTRSWLPYVPYARISRASKVIRTIKTMRSNVFLLSRNSCRWKMTALFQTYNHTVRNFSEKLYYRSCKIAHRLIALTESSIAFGPCTLWLYSTPYISRRSPLVLLIFHRVIVAMISLNFVPSAYSHPPHSPCGTFSKLFFTMRSLWTAKSITMHYKITYSIIDEAKGVFVINIKLQT